MKHVIDSDDLEDARQAITSGTVVLFCLFLLFSFLIKGSSESLNNSSPKSIQEKVYVRLHNTFEY
jgi:hypothetical protein